MNVITSNFPNDSSFAFYAVIKITTSCQLSMTFFRRSRFICELSRTQIMNNCSLYIHIANTVTTRNKYFINFDSSSVSEKKNVVLIVIGRLKVLKAPFLYVSHSCGFCLYGFFVCFWYFLVVIGSFRRNLYDELMHRFHRLETDLSEWYDYSVLRSQLHVYVDPL